MRPEAAAAVVATRDGRERGGTDGEEDWEDAGAAEEELVVVPDRSAACRPPSLVDKLKLPKSIGGLDPSSDDVPKEKAGALGELVAGESTRRRGGTDDDDNDDRGTSGMGVSIPGSSPCSRIHSTDSSRDEKPCIRHLLDRTCIRQRWRGG